MITIRLMKGFHIQSVNILLAATNKIWNIKSILIKNLLSIFLHWIPESCDTKYNTDVW